MNQTVKRSLALLMAFIMCIGLLPALQFTADAEAFSYVYNWGVRGTTATELSAAAESFYTGEYTYEELSKLDGGTSTSDAPNSALYTALYELMEKNHSNKTSYDATRDMYQYTDCQNGGGSISSFYSGKSIGPAWDSGATWNREHTWPNSKSNSGSNSSTTRECDIMMLRPASVSENSSRSNKAYGESSGFYDPNSESKGDYNLHGDVARIVLYVYVRWGGDSTYADGALDYMWGSSGVIESLDILLKWMEEDPVDTWELGRNDSVQSITGTRNVFVDYPELAFLLFGAEVPADMTTPSSEAAEDCGHDNFAAGTPVPATCTTIGYTVYTCQTEGCTYSYKGDKVAALGHNYVDGVCDRDNCGALEDVLGAQIEAAKNLANGEYLAATSTITGTITDTPTASSYTTGSYKFTVSDGTHSILCYYVPVTGGTPQQGDTVTVTGNLTAYNGTVEFDDTATAVLVSSGSSETPENPEQPENPELPASELPVNGDKVVIYAPAYMMALSANKVATYYNAGVDVSGGFDGITEAEIWTVTVNTDGSYTFVSGTGSKLALADDYSSLNDTGANDTWTVTAKEGADGIYYIQNVARENYLEWYASKSNWSTYATSSLSDLFEMSFYIITDSSENPENPEQPEIPAPAPGSGTYGKIDRIADLTEGTYYMSGYLTNYSSGSTVMDWTANPYHVWAGTVSSGDLVTGCYAFNEGALTYASGSKGATLELIAVEDKDNTYYIKINGKYLCSTTAATNRKLALDTTAAEWVASNNSNGGITLTSNGVNLGTAGAASNMLRSYANLATLKYGVVFFVDNTLSCEHEFDEGVVTEPTCTEAGYTTYTCDLCKGVSVVNGDSATGHQDTEEVPQQDPTAGEIGYTAGVYCNDCETWISGHEVINSLGYTVYFVVPTGATLNGQTTMNCNNLGITLPEVTAPEGYEFLGWVETGFAETTDEPETIHTTDKTFNTDADIVLYALFSRTEGGNQTTKTVYKLVTDVSQLVIDKKIVIVAKNTDVAMSQTQNSNNRGQVAVTKNNTDKTVTWTTAVEEFVLKAGASTKPGTYAFYDVDKNQYLYAASSSSNYLRSGSLNENASWSITVTTDGVATVKAQGSNTKNWMRQNSQSSIFSCYSSGQNDICLYIETDVTTGTPGTTYYTTVIGEGCTHATTELQNAEPVSCTEDGYTGDLVCTNSECGATLIPGETIPATGHNSVDGICSGCKQAVVAQIDDELYISLKDAMEAATNGDTIVLLSDLSIDTETFTIADGVSITLDMNGKKLTVTDNATKNYELFYIFGELTVIGNGTIELTSTNDRDWNAMSAIFHNRGGVLTIENGTFKNLGGTDMAWVVDNSGNYYGDATTNIKGGTLDSTYTAIRNRMEQNSHGASGKAILNISGGTITGTTSAVWAQAASTSETAPATGEINVSGGEVGLINTARSSGAVCMTTISGGTVAAFKGEAGELIVTGEGKITGDVIIMTASGEPVEFAITASGLYAQAFAKIDDVNYASLPEALEAAQDGDTVTLLMNIEVSEYLDVYTANNGEIARAFTLDLNGFTISPAEDYAHSDYALLFLGLNQTLTIVDSSEAGTGKITCDKYATVGVYGGVLYLKSGTIETTGTTEDDVAVHVYYWAGEEGSGYEQEAIGTAEISGGTIKGETYVEGDLTVTGGTFEGPVIAEGEKASIAISGGTFSQAVPEEYCAKGYIPTQNPDGTYGVEPECDHANATLVGVKIPDCTEGGYTGDLFCPDCGTTLSTGTPLPANGHDYQPHVTDPTCGAEGYTTYICSVCGDDYVDEDSIVPATGDHEFGAWKTLKAATCTESGMRTCECVCGASQTEVTPATGIHTYGDWSETKAPTCTASGEKTRTCDCGDIQTAAVAALGHTEVVDEAVAATCTVAGKTEGKHCDRCNAVLTAQETIPALGHMEVVDAGKPATHTVDGLSEGKHCAVCNEVLTAQEVIPASGHSFPDNWTVTKEATKTETGEEMRMCSCGETETREIPVNTDNGANPVVIVVIVIVVLGAAAAVVFVVMKKKRA